MKYTYKFFIKAEGEAVDTNTFIGDSEKGVKEEVIEYCDIYGYEAYALVSAEEDKPVKVWTEDEIKNLVQTNDRVLYGALKNLYACQTMDEKNAGTTKEKNGKGFNGVDSQFLSSVSEFLLQKGFLTYKQKVAVRKKLVKYTKQITKLANGYETARVAEID